MLPLLAIALAQQGPLPPIPQPPRLRTILPNGATILVIRRPGAQAVWVRLLLAARGGEDTPATHGRRHLLEHLVAVGTDGTLDRRLETEGAILRAQTLRDATEIAVDAPANKLDLALSAIGEMLRLRPLKTEDVAREAGILRQEAALQEIPTRLSSAAWRVAYGDKGLDPFGDLTAIRAATPAAIAALHQTLTAGPNLVLVVSGDVDLDKATAKATAILRAAPKIERPWTTRGEAKPGRDDSVQGYSEARALPVPAYDDVRTVAALAAALAYASEVPGTFVAYTPSGRPGMVVVGRSGESEGLGTYIDRADPASLYERAQLLVRRWLRRQMDDPGSDASLRGLLLAQSTGYSPDAMQEAIDKMTFSDFKAAFDAFRGDRAITVTGS